MNESEKNRIIAATSHELKELGIKGTDVDELAKKLGISKKTIYHFFKNKEDLLIAAVDREFKDTIFDLKIIAGIKMPRCEKLRASLLLISQRLYEGSYQVKKELSSHALLHEEFSKGAKRVIDYLVEAYFQEQAEKNRILLLSLIDVMIKCATHEMGATSELHVREHVIPFYLQAWKNHAACNKTDLKIPGTSDLEACINS